MQIGGEGVEVAANQVQGSFNSPQLYPCVLSGRSFRCNGIPKYGKGETGKFYGLNTTCKVEISSVTRRA